MGTDPFYIVRQEIQDTVNELQTKMSRFHGLAGSHPERKEIAHDVQQECESVRWQVNELESAVSRAQENPQRFNLAMEEINSRRKWITTTRRHVDGITETLKTATAAPPPVAVANNDKFISSENDKQQLIIRQQDEHLEDIEQAVTRMGRLGLDIHEELQTQEVLLNELDEDVDTTHSRLRSASKKMAEVIRKSGTTGQLLLIAFLVIVLVLLAIFTFY